MSGQWGQFWGVGVGPGDPEWLTLKGLRVLQSVPVLACPQGRDDQPGVAYSIVQRFLTPQQAVVTLDLPFVFDTDTLAAAWEEAATRIVSYLRSGQDVAFVSEGDVSFYSTFTYVARAVHLQAPQVTIEAIPGVASPLAAAASLRSPLAIWDDKVAILPAAHQPEELARALDWADVVILMKVSSVFEEVWHLLAARGLLNYCSLVEWVGTPQEQVYTSLEGLEQYHPPYFSTVIVRQPRR
ncbi:MAG: precorrin-2 C(20)-methyltransferase [Cyanobacteria bacterium J06642_2]